MYTTLLLILGALSAGVFCCPKAGKGWYTFGIVSAIAVLTIGEAASVLFSGISHPYTNHINPIFGGDFPIMDSLSALFVIAISIVAVSITLFSVGYLKPFFPKKRNFEFSFHYFALCVLLISMIFVTLLRGTYAFLFAWELMTLSSFVLVLFESERKEVVRAAVNYLILMHVGFVLLVVAFVTASAPYEISGFNALGVYFAGHNPLPLFILLLVGFGLKAGIFPLHVWLPEVHPVAPSHISAILSGIVTKMGIYGILRTISYLQSDLLVVGILLLTIGIITGLWGILLAAVQNELKKLLAYSTIENIGIIVIGIGAGVLGKAIGSAPLQICGFGGAILHFFNHALFKSMLFMGAGSILTQTHTLNLNALGGISKRMPISALLFLVGALAICALPPFSGFVSEFIIYNGLFEAIAAGDSIWIPMLTIVAISLIGGIAILTFTKAFGTIFLGTPRTSLPLKSHDPEISMLLAQILPLAGILSVGICPILFGPAVLECAANTFGSPLPGFAGVISIPLQAEAFSEELFDSLWGITLAWLLLIAVIGTIYALKTAALKKRSITEMPTWGCGFTAPTPKMQYTAESFSGELQNLAAPLTTDLTSEKKQAHSALFPVNSDFEVNREDKVSHLIGRRWTKTMRKLTARMALFQTGKINHYILQALLFLVLLFVLSLLRII